MGKFRSLMKFFVSSVDLSTYSYNYHKWFCYVNTATFTYLLRLCFIVVMTGKEKLTASEEEIDYCQFHVWYPLLRQHAIKGEAVPLDEEFLHYLREDGIMLPGSSKTVDADSDSEESIDGKVLAVHSEIPEFNRLKYLQDQTQLIMNRFDGEVFVKMNWSAPIDALWVNGETAKCLNVDDVFLLLKSSDRVWFDIEKMYDMCDNSSKKSPEQLYLIVKKWANLNPAMEFRLFVHENQLRGISQRDCCTLYKFLHEQWEDLEDKIVEFYDEQIAGKLSIQSCKMCKL